MNPVWDTITIGVNTRIDRIRVTGIITVVPFGLVVHPILIGISHERICSWEAHVPIGIKQFLVIAQPVVVSVRVIEVSKHPAGESV